MVVHRCCIETVGASPRRERTSKPGGRIPVPAPAHPHGSDLLSRYRAGRKDRQSKAATVEMTTAKARGCCQSTGVLWHKGTPETITAWESRRHFPSNDLDGWHEIRSSAGVPDCPTTFFRGSPVHFSRYAFPQFSRKSSQAFGSIENGAPDQLHLHCAGSRGGVAHRGFQ